MSVPALRFPEFEAEWEETRIGDIATFQRGFDLPSQDRREGTIPIVSSGGITGFHDEAKVHGAGIVTGRYGSIGDLYYLKEPHWPLNTALWVKDFHGNSMDYAYYHLSRVDFAKLSDKTGVPGINRNDLHRIKASNTSLPEQKKIAAFLGVVDAKIAALRARQAGLERYKRGLMQALFSQSLRFTKDDGSAFPDWENTTIGEVGTFYYGKSAPKFSLSDDAPTPCVRYGELYSYYGLVVGEIRSKTNIDPKNLKFSKGMEILVPRVGEDPLDFATCCLLPHAGVAIGEMISVFETQQNQLFYTYYFRTLKFEFAKMVEGGSVSNLYFRYLEPIKIGKPHPDEQALIANALQAMDAKIAAVSDNITEMEAFKKGLLQQMFV